MKVQEFSERKCFGKASDFPAKFLGKAGTKTFWQLFLWDKDGIFHQTGEKKKGIPWNHESGTSRKGGAVT
jgi:hypothetical protein